jgi:uncharacterized caspase-like protein
MISRHAIRIGLSIAIGLVVAHAPRTVLAQPTTPQRWALLVGIDQYLAGIEIPELSYAQNDVDALDAVLKRDGYQVSVLKGPAATRLLVIAALQSMATRVKPQDTFLLYLAGHGLRSSINSKVYWLTSDTTLAYLEATSIRLSHMMDYVADIRGANKIVLLDHCFSGELVAELAGVPAASAIGAPGAGAAITTTTTPPPAPPGGPLAAPTPAPDGGASRGPGNAPHIARNVDPEPIATTFRNQWSSDLGGTLLLAASRGNAYEIARDQHGLFTLSLLKAFDSRAADRNPADGKLSADELRTFVQADVRDASIALQLEQRVTDFNQGSMGGFVVISSLRASTLEQAKRDRDVLRPLIADWYNKDYLTAEDQAQCYIALGKAPDALELGVAVDPGVQAIVKAVRDAAGLTNYQEKDRADILAINLRALRGGR